MMPRLDGWEVCRRIRACSSVPVIMLTARGQEEDELHGFSLGADEYIAKPFSLRKSCWPGWRQCCAAGGGCSCGGTHCPGGIPPAPSSGVEHRPHGAGAPCGRPSRWSSPYTEYELLLYLTDNPGVALSATGSWITMALRL